MVNSGEEKKNGEDSSDVDAGKKEKHADAQVIMYILFT